jgi:hypothetical protein
VAVETSECLRVEVVGEAQNIECVCVDVDQLMVISLPQVVQDGRLVEVGQVGHVLDFLVFWRVHLVHLVFLQGFFLNHGQQDKVNYTVFDCQLLFVSR